MSNAMAALQAAVVGGIGASPALAALHGAFDGPPPRASYPYIAFAGGQVTDWSTKTEEGREVKLALTLWDDGAGGARIGTLTDATCTVIEALPRDLPGWRIASLVFLRARTLRTAAGPWNGLIEYRARMLAV